MNIVKPQSALNPLHPAHPVHSACAPSTIDLADSPPRGCGWFDSSHELRTGLSITEHDSPDRIANELALDVWLTWHLAGPTLQRPACA